MPFGRITRIRPKIASKLFSPSLDSKALLEFRAVEGQLVKNSKDVRLRQFVRPMQRLDVQSLAMLVQRVPALVQQIRAAERPHSGKLGAMVNDAVRRAFGKRMPEFFEQVKTMPLTEARMEREQVRVAEERRKRLLALADKLRMQSMLAHGMAFFMQERMLKMYKRPLDKLDPNLYPRYGLLNNYMRVSYFYHLAGIPALAAYLGKGETKIDFVERIDKRSGERFFVPTAFAKTRGVCLPAMLHEAGEAAAHIASKEITAKALKNLPENERRFIMQQLHGFLPEIHSYVYGPVIFSSLRNLMKVFAKYPLSEMPLEMEREAQRLLRVSYAELKETEVERVINAWNGFLRLPFAKQKSFLEASLKVRTPQERQKLATELRKELHKTIKRRKAQ